MKYAKTSLLTIAAAVSLLAFAGTASATQMTGAGGAVLGVGTEINAQAEGNLILHPPFGEIKCSESSLSGVTQNAGSATTTPTWLVVFFHLTPCGIKILGAGILELHTRNAVSDNRGRLTWHNLEFTLEHLGFHCVFKTNNTDIGTLTGSAVTGGTATIDLEATIPRTGGTSGAFCGSTAQWTGSYKINSPDVLNVH